MKILASQLYKNQRLDPEYYLSEVVPQKNYFLLLDIASVTSGHTPNESGNGDIPFYRVENISKYSQTHPKRHIAKSEIEEDKLTQKEDILMTIKGRVGDACIAEYRSFYNQDIVRIVSKKIHPYVLLAVLHSEYVIRQMRKMSTNQMHPYIRMRDIRKIKIPIIEEKTSEKIIEKMSRIMNTQNEILKNEIKIEENFKAQKSKITSQIKFKKVHNANRIDAEFFVSENAAKKRKKILVGDMNNINVRIGVYKNTYTENGIPYLRAKNIKNGSIIVSDYVPEDKKNISLPNEIFITRVGNIKAVHITNEKYIPSDNFLRIRYEAEKITPQILAAYFNSKIGQREIDRHMQGSKQRRLNKKSLLNVTVPNFGRKKTREILIHLHKIRSLKERKEKMIHEINYLISRNV